MPAPSLPPPPPDRVAARLSQWIGRSSKLPLSALLIVPFVLQIVGAVGLVSWLSYRNGEKAVHDLSSQLRNELIARIEQQIQTYIEIPYSINSINATAITRHDLDVVNPKGEYQLWQQAKIFPATNLIYCGSEHNGELLGVGRSTLERKLQLVVYNQQLTDRYGYYYTLDEDGNQAELLRKGNKKYDARVRPWYKAAKLTGQPTWSDIYLDFDTQLPTITASQPVYTPGGTLLGVCATDFLLPVELNEFLHTLKIGKAGETFIIDRSGTLVSSSTQESIALAPGEQPRLRQAIESQDDLVRETALYLRQHFGGFKAIEQAQQLDFPIQGERHFLQVTPFKDNRGLDWLIVVVVPESNFMAQIHANTRITLWLSGLALLGAIGIGILTARWITRPILRTTQASGEMANGNLDQHVQATPIGELNQLADAFNGMAGQLKQSFTALHQSEVRNRALLQAIPDLIMEVSADGIYLDCVEAKGNNWLITKPEDRIGRRVQDVLPTMAALQYLQAIQLALQTREAQTLEYEVAIRGTMRSYEARVVPMHEASALLIVRDITDRKLAESALRQSEATNRALVAAIPDLLIRATGNGTYLDISGRDRL
ncbi:MAG TPA: cache domain-containing protein, partial [Allocoleopsis sp.]